MTPARSPDGRGEGYTLAHDADIDDQPAMAVVGAVCWITGVDGLELSPLYERIDPTDLNRRLGPGTVSDCSRSAGESSLDELGFPFE